jgi:dTDP-4-amino-4,6-dideoxygalactose transaminase
VFHVYTVRTKDRIGLRGELERNQIQTGIHYPIPIHLQPAYRDLQYTRGAFPVAEQACAEVLALPIYPEMTDTQIHQVAQIVREQNVPV